MATMRFIVNDEPMDVAAVDVPNHIRVRDSGVGYGSRCLIVECGGAAVDAGVDAFRAVYPNLRVTSERSEAARLCRRRRITPHKGGRNVKKSTDVTLDVAKMLEILYQQYDISLGDIVEEAVNQKYHSVTAGGRQK